MCLASFDCLLPSNATSDQSERGAESQFFQENPVVFSAAGRWMKCKTETLVFEMDSSFASAAPTCAGGIADWIRAHQCSTLFDVQTLSILV